MFMFFVFFFFFSNICQIPGLNKVNINKYSEYANTLSGFVCKSQTCIEQCLFSILNMCIWCYDATINYMSGLRYSFAIVLKSLSVQLIYTKPFRKFNKPISEYQVYRKILHFHGGVRL